MQKSRDFYWKIRGCIIAVVILINVSIQAEEAPELVIQKGHSDTITSVAISRDGKYIAAGSYDYTVRLWDVTTGKRIRTFSGHKGSVFSVALSGDGQTLVSGSNDKTVRLWGVTTGKEIRTFSGHTDAVWSVAISVDGQTLVSGSDDHTVRLWDVTTGKEIRVFAGHTAEVTSIALSGDGQTLVSGSEDRTLRLWDVKTGREIHTFKGHTSWVSSVALSWDSQILVSGSYDDTVRLWDFKTGKEIRAFSGHTSYVTSVALNGGSKFLVSGSGDKTVHLCDIKTGKEIRTFNGHTGVVWSVALSGDGQTLVSGSRNGEIKIWDLQKGYLLATLVSFEDNEWVAYTPDSYYNCSPNGEKYVSFRVGKIIYDSEKYASLFNKGDVIADRFRKIANVQTTNIETTKPVEKQPVEINTTPSNEPTTVETQGFMQPPTVVIRYFKCKGNLVEEENPVVESPEVEITATVKDNENVIKKIIITVNDITLSEKNLSGKTYNYKLKQTIALSESTNRVKIIAINTMDVRGVEEKVITYHKTTAKGDNSLRDLVKSVFGKKRSWAVLIGVKDYSLQRNGMNPLPYALNDVQAVKNYLITGLDFDKDNIKTLVDSQATREEIIKELGENIPGRVGTNDRVLVYFTGHGGKEIRKTDEEILSYLIPYDGKQESLYSTGIPIDVLSDLSKRIPAKHVLFVIDACFSGNIGQITKDGGYPEETKKEIKTFIKNKSREVITAGTKDEVANMGYEWNKHSVYTYYLLKGLRGGADYNQNKVITLSELQLYLETQVTKEVSVKQTPQRIPLESREGGQFVFYREGEE